MTDCNNPVGGTAAFWLYKTLEAVCFTVVLLAVLFHVNSCTLAEKDVAKAKATHKCGCAKE